MFGAGRRRLFTLAALLPVLVAIILPAVASVSVCRYGMVVNAEGCCPKQAGRNDDPGAHLEAVPCCATRAVPFDRLISESSIPPAGVRVWILPSTLRPGALVWSRLSAP